MPLPDRMMALVKREAAPGAELMEVPRPSPGPGEVLVKVRVASICGTDVHIYEWNEWAAGRVKSPLVFGHEFAGDVVALGPGADGLMVGDYVSAETHIICNQCYQCRTGQGHICRRCSIIGVDRPGTFAEYVALPAANVWPNPPDMPPEIASIQEPFGNAVDTVFAGDVTGKSFLVIGCGPIGLMAVGLLRASGAHPVIASDLSEYRLDLARRMGADIVLDAGARDVVAETLAETGGEGVDAVLEMSGARVALKQAVAVARNGGRISVLGLPPGAVEFDVSPFVFKGLTLQGITGRRMFDTWYRTRAILSSGRVDLGRVITHTFPLTSFKEAFALAESGLCGKIVLTL